MNYLINAAVLSVALVSLAGCGGGGTTTPTVIFVTTPEPTPEPAVYLFTSVSEMLANSIAILQGSAETAEYSGGSGSTSISNKQSGSSTLNLGAKNGETNLLALSAPGSSIKLETANGDNLVKAGTVNIWSKKNGDDTALFDGGYEYQTFGSWLTGINSNSGTIGAGSYGAATSANKVPSGTASYNGGSIGVAKANDNNLYATSSTITV